MSGITRRVYENLDWVSHWSHSQFGSDVVSLVILYGTPCSDCQIRTMPLVLHTPSAP